MVTEHKNLPIRAIEGKRIHAVYDMRWKAMPCKITAPDSKKLLNFEVTAGSKTFLVLDPYGDEHVPQELRKQVFGETESFSIAIDRESGQIFQAHAILEKNKTALFLCPLCTYSGEAPHLLPAAWLPLLDELKSMKRPFALTFDPQMLMSYIIRESSLQDLRMAIHVRLHFNKNALEVTPALGSGKSPSPMYREVGFWV